MIIYEIEKLTLEISDKLVATAAINRAKRLGKAPEEIASIAQNYIKANNILNTNNAISKASRNIGLNFPKNPVSKQNLDIARNQFSNEERQASRYSNRNKAVIAGSLLGILAAGKALS